MTFEELFEFIDDDGSGEVSIDEFCEGISKMACSESPVELFVIMKQINGLKNTFDDFKMASLDFKMACKPRRRLS
eukprot:6932594-Heterocapsa_arctica.AAC.1